MERRLHRKALADKQRHGQLLDPPLMADVLAMRGVEFSVTTCKRYLWLLLHR